MSFPSPTLLLPNHIQLHLYRTIKNIQDATKRVSRQPLTNWKSFVERPTNRSNIEKKPFISLSNPSNMKTRLKIKIVMVLCASIVTNIFLIWEIFRLRDENERIYQLIPQKNISTENSKL